MNEEETQVKRAQDDREKVIVRTSLIGIAANVFLAALKAAIGILANSIAVILDAVNNLSDALSSVITIVGAKLAGKKPDKKHPLGYGRIEYLSAMIVAAIVLYAGITSLVESVKKIIHPETADYSVLSLVIIASAVVVKLLLGRYVKAQGEKVNSGSLIASGSDALFDAILSASVLLSAIIFLTTGVSLEAFVGVVISVIIIKSGIEMLMETLDDILGKRIDREYLSALRKTICEEEAITGAFDLFLHSYGPDRMVGSVHVEVPDTMTAEEIDSLERRIAQNVYMKHGVIMSAIGIYSRNTVNDEAKEIRSRLTHLIMSYEDVLQIHGFYADLDAKRITCDVILDYELKDREELFRQICEEAKKEFPDYQIELTLDIDL